MTKPVARCNGPMEYGFLMTEDEKRLLQSGRTVEKDQGNIYSL